MECLTHWDLFFPFVIVLACFAVSKMRNIVSLSSVRQILKGIPLKERISPPFSEPDCGNLAVLISSCSGCYVAQNRGLSEG